MGEIISLIYLLRYGLYIPHHNNKPILNIKTIAATLKLSTYKIKQLLKMTKDDPKIRLKK